MKSSLRAYGLLLWWQFLRFRNTLVLIVVVQVALALGIVYGLAFLFPSIDPTTALFLSTGAPTLTLLVMGLSVVPQEVSQAKVTGRLEYLSSLPVPRLAALAADVTFWLLAQLPGTVLALVVASIRFDFGLRVGAAVVPAILLVALTAACVGYAMAMALQPHVAQQLTSILSIGLLLFSPITFPISRLPGALRAIHRVLPITYMADLVRWSLTGRFASQVGLAFAVAAAWCFVALAGSYRMAVRRR
jgi:ABC-2 type transport system permease protein